MKKKCVFLVMFLIISFCTLPKSVFGAENVYCPLCKYRSSDGPIYYKERQFFQKVKILKDTYKDSIDTTALTYAVLYRYTGADIAYEKEYDKNFDPNEYKRRNESLISAYSSGSSDSLSQSDIDLIIQNEKYDLLSLAALVMVDSNKNGSYSDVCFMDGMSGNRLVGNTSSKSLNPLENFFQDIQDNVINYLTCFNETLRGTDSYVGDSSKVRNATENLRVSNINNVCKYGYIGGLFNGVKNISNDEEREAQKRVIAQAIIDKSNYYRRMYAKEEKKTVSGGSISGNTQASELNGKSREERIDIIGPMAQALYSQSGIFASVTIAQAIQESGIMEAYEAMAQNGSQFGQDMIAQNNTSGVKCRSNFECRNGYTVFPSLEVAFGDRADMFNNGAYEGWDSATTPEEQISIVGPSYCPVSDGCGDYAGKIISVINQYDLKKWDVKGSVSSNGTCTGTSSTNGWSLRTVAPTNTDSSFTEFEKSNGSSNRGQCVWYAKGRAFEIANRLKEKSTINDEQANAIKKLVLSIGGNGGDIYDNAKDKFNTSNDIKKPKAGSFIVWKKKGDYGHVAVVEEVTDNNITVIGGYTSTGSCPNSWDCIKLESKTMSLEEFYNGWGKNYNGGYEFDGYVYLLEPKNVSGMPSINNSCSGSSSDQNDAKFGSSKDYVCIDGEAVSRGDLIGTNETCANKNGKTKVLFVGNSRTYVHDIPSKFSSIASSMGYKVDVTTALSGGKTLAQLSDLFPSEISSKYDCVVMQEQTETYLYNYDLFAAGAKSVVNKVKSANKDVKTYVRQTWGRNDSGRAELDNAYSNAERVASETGSFIIPDGKAFEKSASDYPNISLLEDDRHQSNEGAYLSASTIFKKLYGISPKSNYYGGVNKENAKKLQDVADKVVVVNSSSVNFANGKGSLTADQRRKIIEFAESQMGVPYNYARSWDNDVPNAQLTCNGLTYHAYKAAGINIPQGSIDQMSSAPVVTSTGKVSDMTPGDIIVYDNAGYRSDISYTPWSFRHVALYAGNGELIEGTPPAVQRRAIGDNGYSYSVTW